MYISKLRIEGYKNTNRESSVILNKGLNILVGENGSGKTAIINALRLLLREKESNTAFSEGDLYC
ncbi:AAA family ATPase [Metallumcola ferriviriculae]|uniref:AAA family ATPase n=1 Tax=Metallumcola ferriviriculae TaxID=3039180 RepID=A0AAU0UL55_9FIRM|nr:AAA family ATPase [Desulfitibacteraceae bacterium MK1]